MPTSFINSTANEVGTTEVLLYTTPANDKAILIGCNIANRVNSTVPFDIYIKKGSNIYYIIKDHRIATGSNVEVMKGNKIVLNSGNTVYVKAYIADSLDITLSILSGVT